VHEQVLDPERIALGLGSRRAVEHVHPFVQKRRRCFDDLSREPVDVGLGDVEQPVGEVHRAVPHECSREILRLAVLLPPIPEVLLLQDQHWNRFAGGHPQPYRGTTHQREPEGRGERVPDALRNVLPGHHAEGSVDTVVVQRVPLDAQRIQLTLHLGTVALGGRDLRLDRRDRCLKALTCSTAHLRRIRRHRPARQVDDQAGYRVQMRKDSPAGVRVVDILRLAQESLEDLRLDVGQRGPVALAEPTQVPRS
jgi:hypothetical protein